jgi:hypothetical protein
MEQPEGPEVRTAVEVVGDAWILVVTYKNGRLNFEFKDARSDEHLGGWLEGVDAKRFLDVLNRIVS